MVGKKREMKKIKREKLINIINNVMINEEGDKKNREVIISCIDLDSIYFNLYILIFLIKWKERWLILKKLRIILEKYYKLLINLITLIKLTNIFKDVN